MDVISDILRLLNLRSSVYFHASFCGSWSLDGKNPYQATFHLIARGNCWLHLADQNINIALTGGDLVVFPRDVIHTISNGQQPPDKVDDPPRPAGADEIPSASLICGYFDFESPQINPLLTAMPDVIHIKNEDPGRTSAMNSLLNWITSETETAAPGSEAMVDKLTEILFIHVVRAYMTHSNVDRGFLAALTDKTLSQVLTAVHKAAGEKWSVDKLAEQAGMSRSVFAKHFQQVMDMTPMQYVTRWRMQVAYESLHNSKTPVALIAEQAGYQTEASFRKAFKDVTGESPGVVRKAGAGGLERANY
jgi:AraC family transcriptional activator of mtrCDE